MARREQRVARLGQAEAHEQVFAKALAELAFAFRLELDAETVEQYWGVLQKHDDAHVLEALKRSREMFETFPPIVEIKRVLLQVALEAERKASAAKLGVCQHRHRCDCRKAEPALRRFAFLLAELADPDVPEAKKEKIRSEWNREYGAHMPPPWERGAQRNG